MSNWVISEDFHEKPLTLDWWLFKKKLVILCLSQKSVLAFHLFSLLFIAGCIIFVFLNFKMNPMYLSVSSVIAHHSMSIHPSVCNIIVVATQWQSGNIISELIVADGRLGFFYSPHMIPFIFSASSWRSTDALFFTLWICCEAGMPWWAKSASMFG